MRVGLIHALLRDDEKNLTFVEDGKMKNEKLESLLALKQNWDSYGAPPINREYVSIAEQLIAGWTGPLAPTIAPTRDGGVGLQWENDSFSLSVTIDGNYSSLFFRNNLNGKELSTRLEV